ncbi:hypothetical protein BJ912DRAFT_89820 [Pholiota molesta]|nr:hypothetical protein BJ912DRAFT_89820 [Pholiota molesta]
MITFGNDLCSYEKEVLADDADYNAVTVIIKTKTDVAGAVQFISDTCDGLVERCLQLRDDILTKRGFPSFVEDLDRQIAVYIDGIGQWVRGHDEWMFASGRYFGDKGPEIQKTRKVDIIA